MNLVGALLRVLAVLVTVTIVEGGGCSNVKTYGLPVINMCEKGNMTLGRVFISITTSNMGSNTRCNCTVRARTPGLETSTSLVLRNVESNASRCNESLIQVTIPNRIDMTCTSMNDSVYHTGQTTNDFMILLTRADALVGVSYCLILQPDMAEANGLELICSSDQQPKTTPSTTTNSPSTSSYRSSTSSSPPMPQTSTSPTFQPSMMTTSSRRSDDPADSARTVNTNGRDILEFPTGAVVGGLLGAIALICLTVVVSVYIRYRFKAQPPVSNEPGAENSAYDALSDVTRVNPRADPSYAVIQSEPSSSQPGGNDAFTTTGVYETVEGASSVTQPATYVSNNSDTQNYYNVFEQRQH